MDPMEKGGSHSIEEVVFVLRVRAGTVGWWGQVKQLDTGSLRYAADTEEIYRLLENAWQLAKADERNDRDRR